uniref:Putative NAD dependent epimerase/dehydratase family protein n=1 Tax=Magnetococcus massalia (strain MO-1) TaxID=451514 RepID=A0A1S7LH38_MAGMO|nr:putative NAD dependent epimerase/dehydratase family protein [Candidatus Magnetococcus massalia]
MSNPVAASLAPLRTRVLVTGGAGFIGSEVVHQLAALGAEVEVVDNLTNGKAQNINDLLSDRVKLHAVDIRDNDAMVKLLDGVEIVIHMATLGVRHSINNPKENHDVNATATLELLANARAHGVRRVVNISTSEVYGTGFRVPMDENHPTFPHTVYGASKLAGECYARGYNKTYGYDTVVVRPFNVFGPRCHHEGDSGEVIPKFLLRSMAGKPLAIFGDGQQTRDFTYVSDAALGILQAAASPATCGETVNLGAGKELTIQALAEEVMKVTGKRAEIAYHDPRPGDVLRLYADTARAQQLFDYRPKVGLEAGLAHLKAWYEARPESLDELLAEEWTDNWNRRD